MTNEERFEENKALHGAALARGELVECRREHDDARGCSCSWVRGVSVVSCEVDSAHGPARALVDDDAGGMFICIACLTAAAEAGEEDAQLIAAKLTGKAAA